MIDNNFFIGVFLSLMLGALYGVQREIRKQNEKKVDFAGLRTFTLISLLGYLIGFLSFGYFDSIYLFLVGFVCLFALVIVAYKIMSSKKKGEILSILSEILSVFSFMTGILISLNFIYEAIVLTITIVIILFLGDKLHLFAKNLTREEIFGALKFFIISAVMLPILPNKNYSPMDWNFISTLAERSTFISGEFLSKLDVFNFYHLWLMVVFVSGIAFIGYVLTKTIGAKKGFILTGFLGGLMSSTALTTSFAIESKKNPKLLYPLVVGIIIACSTMFFRILFEVSVLNFDLVINLFIPLIVMGCVGYMAAYYLFRKIKDGEITISRDDLKSPFSIKPALGFGFLFLAVMFFSKLFTLTLGNSGIYLLSFISGITDVDAITISLAGLSTAGSVSLHVATIGIVLAAISNTIFKAGFCYVLGSKKLSNMIFYSFGLILIVGSILLFF